MPLCATYFFCKLHFVSLSCVKHAVYVKDGHVQDQKWFTSLKEGRSLGFKAQHLASSFARSGPCSAIRALYCVTGSVESSTKYPLPAALLEDTVEPETGPVKRQRKLALGIQTFEKQTTCSMHKSSYRAETNGRQFNGLHHIHCQSKSFESNLRWTLLWA